MQLLDLPIWTIIPAKSSFYSERLTVDILTIGLTVQPILIQLRKHLFLILWHVPCSKKEDDPGPYSLCSILSGIIYFYRTSYGVHNVDTREQ